MRLSFYFWTMGLLLLSCTKDVVPDKNAKSQWLESFFQEVQRYDDIYALSYWHENFDNTTFRLDSSEEATQTFKSLIANPVYLSSCSFASGKLQAISGKKYFGSFPDFCGEEDCVSIDKIQAYETLVDKNLAWAYFSNNWGDDWQFPQDAVQSIIEAGRTPFIRLMPRSEFEAYQQDPVWKLTDIINGVHDAKITAWAHQAKAVSSPLLVEFGTEVNGLWFSWNGSYYGGGTTDLYGDTDYPDGPEIFRDAYRHIIDLCNDTGADNITWFFHFDVYNEPDEAWNDPVYYYPGDAYIDWLGVSTYGPYAASEASDASVQPENLLRHAHEKFRSISTQKPYAILEFGATEF